MASVLVFSIFVNILMLTGPLFMLQVYDRVLGSRSEETLVALFVLVALLYGLMGTLDFARGRVLARFGARFQSHLDSRVFEAVLSKALTAEVRKSQSSGLRDLELIQSFFTSPLILALFDLPWTIMFIAAIFVLHSWLGWMAIFGASTLVVITILNNFLTKRKTLEAQSAARQADGFAEQIRHSAEIIRAQGMGAAVLARWHLMRDSALEHTIGSNDWIGFFSSLTKTFRLFLQSTMLALGAYLVLNGEMTGGAMIAGSILLGRALAPIEQSIGQWPNAQRALGAWASLEQLLESTPPSPAKHALPKPIANVVFKGVNVVMPGAKSSVLNSISFSVAAGEVLGVIGKSGSGKSTLAKTILGLTRVISGEVRFGGATLDQYGLAELGTYIGYLPQRVDLFSGTVAENISRMMTVPNDLKVVEAAKRANAHEMILSLPEGYETVVHTDDDRLSGGQKQRIALARAFFGDPILLVLDEPNSALDNEGSVALNIAIKEFKASNRSVIILTHRPAAISECDRLIVVEEGRIKADGPRDEVIKSVVKNVHRIQRSIARASRL